MKMVLCHLVLALHPVLPVISHYPSHYPHYPPTMKIVHSTPVLQAIIARSGDPKFWQGHIISNDAGGWFTQVSFWRQKVDGTMSVTQWSEAFPIVAKNVGKSTEISAEQQAYLEIERDVKKQKKKGFTEV